MRHTKGVIKRVAVATVHQSNASKTIAVQYPDNVQLLVFEEPNIKIYQSMRGDIGRCKAEATITFHTPINLDIGLFRHQLLFHYFSVTSV